MFCYTTIIITLIINPMGLGGIRSAAWVIITPCVINNKLHINHSQIQVVCHNNIVFNFDNFHKYAMFNVAY